MKQIEIDVVTHDIYQWLIHVLQSSVAVLEDRRTGGPGGLDCQENDSVVLYIALVVGCAMKFTSL